MSYCFLYVLFINIATLVLDAGIFRWSSVV